MAQNGGFVGLDVGKFEIFAFISKTGMTFSVPNTSSGHRKLRSKLGPARGQIIALEPTGGYAWAVWEALDVAGYDVRQVSAAHVRAFSRASGALAKTYPIDARLIADFIAFRPTSGRKFPAKKLRYLNALSTKRRQLVDLRKRLKCQTTQHSDSAMVALDVELSDLISRQITMLDDAILAQIKSDPQKEQHSKILRSIPGVGPVLCAALIGEMPELGAIGEKQIAALAGLAPINRESGRMDARRAIKGGRAIIHSQLYQAALVATTHNKPHKVFAERLRERGKPHKVALIAVAHKLLTTANALMAKNQLWDAT